MVELKKLQIPESTLDLRDFSNYSKSFSEYVEFSKFYENQINEGKKDLYTFGIKILREHFIKDFKEWKKVLTNEDIQKLNELKNLDLKNKNQIFIKCSKKKYVF